MILRCVVCDWEAYDVFNGYSLCPDHKDIVVAALLKGQSVHEVIRALLA